ncbi:helix-turn-helix domain-containing protein [Lactobacillus paragasseri]|uniref:Helix-turn-helix domain-containing protein n=1 Tax=Lactobacillus paragasseri TaxID=2107999 RepID=A0ABD5A375_9LACO|nr:helix-turn-helix domain-containing protein [Lactobacillus paragasseri]MDK7953355.1 helix-turn-helix domain-containing protein [Lactobacillus paragasseri]MDO6362212.1 helix-turn-helix domain-containing protein [Lactobacillus paragasseri]MDX5060547.1 helix-turn-helix domain-containing protein [Lactobacillus paragasseri]
MVSEYLNFKDARTYLSIKSPNALKKYIDAGLPVSIVGKSKKIRKSAIDEFMKEHEVVAKPQESK